MSLFQSEPVFVTGVPGFDITERRQALMPAGMSLLEFAREILPGVPDECFFADGRAILGDQVILGEFWHRVRPKTGTSLVIRIIPSGGNIFRTGLQLAVLVAAVATAAYLGPLAGPLVASVGAAGVTVVGNLLINMFVPVRDAKAKDRAESYTIESFRNPLAIDAPIAFVLGQMRVALPHIARPFSQSIDSQQWVTTAIGAYGPLDLADIRIGDTPIEKYAGPSPPDDGTLLSDFTSDTLEVEVRLGYDDDDPLTLYPTQVVEIAQSVDLGFTVASGKTSNREGDPVVRVTPADIDRYQLDFTFPQGLYRPRQTSDELLHVSVHVLVRERKVGTVPWTTVFDDAYTDDTQDPITRTFDRTVPERGTYEIEVTKTGVEVEGDNTPVFHSIQWSITRGFRPEYPINFPKPLFLLAVKVRASGQLNGALDELNCVLTSICPDWDADTETWITRVTRNPASLFRHVLQGPMKLRPVSDDRINLTQLQDWHEFCDDHDLTYDRVHDFESSSWDVLSDIASAGRATPQRLGGQWGVVIDRPVDRITAAISPQNSWGFEEEIPQAKLPDALRIGFKDRTNKWVRAERIVPLPSFVGTPQIFRAIEPPGITDPEVAYREGLRIGYGLELRKRTISISQDFESLVTVRGDLAGVSHDVLSSLQMQGRVRSINGHVIETDQDVTFTEGEDYGIRFLYSGEAQLGDIWGVATPSFPDGEEEVTQRVLTLVGSNAGPAPDLPSAGDRYFFGPIESVVEEMLVKGIQRGSNNTAKLLLVDHRPEIQQLVADAVVPAWDGRVGEVGGAPSAPSVPVITAVLTSTQTTDGNVLVKLKKGSGGGPVQSYDVQHRLQGAVPWSTVSTSSGSASFAGYDIGDIFEVQARAVGPTGLQSAYTSIVTTTFGSEDPAPLDPPDNVSGSYSFDILGGALAAKIHVTWDAGVAGDSFDVQFGPQSGGASSTVSTDVDATDALTLFVADEESYRVRVRAVRGSEVSDWSAWVNVDDISLLEVDTDVFLAVDASTVLAS